MRNTIRLAFVVLALAALAALAACTQLAPKAPGVHTSGVVSTQSNVRPLISLGTATLQGSAQAGKFGLQNPEFPASLEKDIGATQAQGPTAGRSGRVVNRIPTKRPTPYTAPRSTHAAGRGKGGPGGPGGGAPGGASAGTTFEGLNHYQQRSADDGNQFSLEPPDQALCAGNGYVLEAVNDVLQVYDTSGNPQLSFPMSLNEFFFGDHAIDRTTGEYGEFITDPTCLYDGHTWFLVVLTLEVDPATGDFTQNNFLDIAATTATDPAGAVWNKSRLDVTYDGPNPGCPCLGDYPHIGVNADGLFITTDSFDFVDPYYYGAWVYGIDKAALGAGNANQAVAMPLVDDHNLVGYSVAPAIAGADNPDASPGVEYLTSALTVFEPYADAIDVWAVTGTGSLDNPNPSLSVSSTRVDVSGIGGYADPVGYAVPQKRGNVPLAQALTGNMFGYGTDGKQVEGPVATNDSGMKQAMFVNGHLYAALTTAVDNGAGLGGGPGAGVAWFDLTPSITGNTLGASLHDAGIVALGGANLIFPAMTVNAGGQGAIAVTQVGSNDYPSAAFIPFSTDFATDSVGSPQVIRSGAGPQDGFTEYWLGGYSPRWGDYGAGAVDGSGNIWIASETINQTCRYRTFVKDMTCGQTRSALANWSTQVTQITP